MLQALTLRAIKRYQQTLSPDHGPLRRFWPAGYCQYQPSCSEYGYQAIKRYGLLRGGLLAAWRIIRCNPFSHGGIDPVI